SATWWASSATSSPLASSSRRSPPSGKSSRIRTYRTSRQTRTWPHCSTVCSGTFTVSPSSTPTASSSSPSTALALSSRPVYLTIFFLFSDKKNKKKMEVVLAAEALFMAAVALGVLLGVHTHQRRSLIVGILCVIFDTIMYSSPLTVMSQVVKTKSVEYMPLLLSVVSFLNGLYWTSYTLIRFDIFITIPNGLGVLFAAVQLILYVIYYRTTPKKQNKNLELPTVTPVAKDTSVGPISKDNDLNGSTASHVTIDITIQP
ncbi:Os09g0254600, partial [Oryza sativa Japonica Group]